MPARQTIPLLVLVAILAAGTIACTKSTETGTTTETATTTDAAAATETDPGTIEVSWNFGGPPGRTGDRFAGSRILPVTYEPEACLDKWVLEKLQHECPFGDDGIQRVCPASLFATFRKRVEGPEGPPTIDVMRPEYTSTQESTGELHTDSLPYTRDMATPVEDWNAANIEIFVGHAAPSLHNPTDWTEIRVVCD
jgi:hypothetical protein